MRIKAFIVGATLAFLTNGVTGPTVMDKIHNSLVLAMIGQDQPTESNIIDHFEMADTIIIRSGVGGALDGMIQTLEYLDSNPDKTIVIDGECASACTLLLSRPNNVVFTERASFLFHSAYIGRCRKGLFHYDKQPSGNKRMLMTFPRNFRAWLIENKVFDSVDLVRLSAKEAAIYFPKMIVDSYQLPSIYTNTTIKVDDNPLSVKAALKTCNND
jgi:hypothetical protein